VNSPIVEVDPIIVPPMAANTAAGSVKGVGLLGKMRKTASKVERATKAPAAGQPSPLPLPLPLPPACPTTGRAHSAALLSPSRRLARLLPEHPCHAPPPMSFMRMLGGSVELVLSRLFSEGGIKEVFILKQIEQVAAITSDRRPLS